MLLLKRENLTVESDRRVVKAADVATTASASPGWRESVVNIATHGSPPWLTALWTMP